MFSTRKNIAYQILCHTSLIFDLVLNQLIQLHLILIQFPAKSRVLTLQVIDLQTDGLQLPTSLSLLPSGIFEQSVQLGYRLLFKIVVRFFTIL
jgi:hypothetical protein